MDKVLDGGGPRRQLIQRAAGELRLSTRQVYTLLHRYGAGRTVSALLPRTHAPRRKRLHPEVEAIIEATLREQWLVLEEPPLAPIVAEIRARCQEAGHRPPSHMTVAARIPVLFSDEEIAKKRSANAARVRRLKPRPGYIHAPQPLAVCQMDHTPTDINFVDVIDQAGTFVGRAFLTILVDVFSRCILGFCLTLEKPSVLSVALCLAHAMCRKEEWMAARGLGHHAWPTYGRPARLHTDSGKDFRSKAFARGCEGYGIETKRRHRGQVHEGGVVERLLGKVNGIIGANPGGTGRSVADRDEYPAERRACLTFADLEKCMALAIVDHNSEENTRALKVPIKEWLSRSDAIVQHNDDPDHVLLTFLPGKGRVLTPQGISLFALDYYDHWLGPLVPLRDRLGELEVRYDPRDISHIYMRHPGTGAFRPVGRRDRNRTPITLWQHQRDRRVKREANRRSPVEQVAVRREIRGIVASAQARQKAEVRDAARTAHAAAAPKPYETMQAAAAGEPQPAPAVRPDFCRAICPDGFP